MVTTSTETSSGGRYCDWDNDAHLMIDSCEAERSDYGMSLKTQFSILGSTEASQVGKIVSEYIKTDGNAAGMSLNLAEAAGLITREQREAARKNGVGVTFDESLLKGRQICAQIKMEQAMVKNPATGEYVPNPDKPQKYARVGFRTFSVWDKRMAHVPKDQVVLGMALPRPPAGDLGPPQQPQGAPLPPKSPQPAPVQQPAASPAPTSVDMTW